MPNPFKYLDYRSYFKDEITARKRLDSTVNFQNMANVIRIQKPFLSKVVNGHNHLNQDQLHLACMYMNLSQDEVDFIELSRDFQASSLKIRKDKIEKTLTRIQKEKLDTENHLEANRIESITADSTLEYYLDPIYQLVHVALSIERYSSDFRKMAHDLMIPVPRIAMAIDKLEQLKIIKRQGSKIKVIAHNLHLPRTAREYRSWYNQLRFAAINRTQDLTFEEAYGYSVVFSTTEEIRQEIQERFIKFLNAVQKLCSGTSEDNVYQLNFDLFNWNSPMR